MWGDWARTWEQERPQFNFRCCHRFAVCWWEPPHTPTPCSPLNQGLCLTKPCWLCEPVSAQLLLWARAEIQRYSLTTIKVGTTPRTLTGIWACHNWKCLLRGFWNLPSSQQLHSLRDEGSAVPLGSELAWGGKSSGRAVHLGSSRHIFNIAVMPGSDFWR